MKLFWRDHVPLLILQLATIGIMMVVYWLGGYRNTAISLYAAFLSIIACAGFLTYRYFSHREYYRRLSTAPASLDQALEAIGQAAAPLALQQLLHAHYRLLQQQITGWEQQKNTHLLFINQWVHQMKTPLAVIDLTLQKGTDADDLSSIREESDRLRAGLETVLHAARLQSFEHDFHIRLVSLSAVVDQAVHECKRLFIRSLVYPSIGGDKALRVRSDEKWLLFMLVQLLTNAIKYSAGAHKKVEVRIDLQRGHAALEIRDEGIGIPQADIRRVFEPFYTGDNGRRYRESTGMGLYLVKQACEHLHHEIELLSTPGEGTTVRLLFPSWEGGDKTSANEKNPPFLTPM